MRVVVADWRPLLGRLDAAVRELEMAPDSVPRDLLAESTAFLEWLGEDNFTFLGSRELELRGDAEAGDLASIEGSGLGVLRDASVQVLRRGTELVAMTPEVRRFFFEPAPLIITKANVMSRVHRRAHMDYIGVKTYRRGRQPQRRDPPRRPVYVPGLRAPAQPDPVPAPQGRQGAGRLRLSARQP